MTLTPKTIFCYECRKGFRTEKGCRAHGSAKSHQWMTPSGAVVSISVPTAPSGLAAELSSQVVTLAAHVKGERIMSQFVYCPLCARRWGTWFELNRHYIQEHPVHPALEDLLRSQCASPGPLVIEDEDEDPVEVASRPVANQSQEVNVDPFKVVDDNIHTIPTTSLGILPITDIGPSDAAPSVNEPIIVVEYPAVELVAGVVDNVQNDGAHQQTPDASSTVTPVIAMSKKAIKKAKKAEKASQNATKVETKAEKKTRKATAKAERKVKKAAERAAREQSSQAAGIDSIDAIKDQIADLKKTHTSLARETTKVIARLTAFHDGVLSLHPSGENADINGGPSSAGTSGTAVIMGTKDESAHLSDEQLLHIFALRHGPDMSSKLREIIARKDAHSDGSQSGDADDVPSPTSLPKSLSDSWEKAVFDELRGSSVNSNIEGAQDARAVTGNVSVLRCRLCTKDVCDEPVATPCGHVFCHGCIGKELVTHTKCPVCRRTVLQSLALE